MSNNPLWQFSIENYRKPGVEPILLQLQDRFDVDINMVLCCCWLASEFRSVSLELQADLISEAKVWRDSCVKPLREVRRFLKSQGVDEGVYQQAKTLELSAEHGQQELMVEFLNRQQLLESESPKDELAKVLLALYLQLLPNVTWLEVAESCQQLLVVMGFHPNASGRDVK